MSTATTKSKAPKLAPRPPLGATQIKVYTIPQIEQAHPGVQGRLRGWIHRADSGDPEFAGLRLAVIRVDRSVLLDDLRFVEFLRQRSLIPASPARSPGRPRNSKSEVA